MKLMASPHDDTRSDPDLLLKAGNHTIYVSVHQARFLNSIHMDMIPFFDDNEFDGPERG